ncbi:putative serine/threonine-protein kinase, partial [Sesbania bispinosa]
MKNKPVSPSSVATTTFILSVVFILFFLLPLATLSAPAPPSSSSTPPPLSAVVAEQPTRRTECYRRGHVIVAKPNISFSAISGWRSYFCGLRSANYTLLCWDTLFSFKSKRLYNNGTVLFENLAVGDEQVCVTVVGAVTVSCWRIDKAFELPSGSEQFLSIIFGSEHF